MADIHYIRQKEPKGLGHAVWCARKFIGDEPFAVLLGDDIVQANKPCLKQMIEQYEQLGSSIIGVQHVPWEETSRYGIVDGQQISECLYKVEGLVEKPKDNEAPSNLAIMGRYILSPTVFQILTHQKPGAGGEIQLTDALSLLNQLESVHAFNFNGKRYDVGDKIGFIKTTLEFALRREDLRERLFKYMKEEIGNYSRILS